MPTELHPDPVKTKAALYALFDTLKETKTPRVESAYALGVYTFLLCNISLKMSDAEYLRFCETIIKWGHDLMVPDEEWNKAE